MPSIWSCLCIKRQRIHVTRRSKPWKKRGFHDTTSSSDISVNAYRRVPSRGGFDVIFTGANVAPFPIGTDGQFDGNTLTKLLEDNGPKKRRRVQDIFNEVPLIQEHRSSPGTSEGGPKYTTGLSGGGSKYTTGLSGGGSKYTTGLSGGGSKYTTRQSDGGSKYNSSYLLQKKNILTRIPGNRNTFLGQTQDSESMYGYVPKATQNVYASTALEGRHVEDYFSDCRMNAALGKFASADMCQNMERMWKENRMEMVSVVNADVCGGQNGRLNTVYDVGEDAGTELCDGDFDVLQRSRVSSSEPLIVGACPASVFSSDNLFVCGTDDDILY